MSQIAKDGEVERLKVEISELHKSKCQSLELIEQRDAEIREKDGVIQSYHDKMVNQADSSAGKEARIHEVEAKLTHCQATCNRIEQEKELLEKHNLWLDEELKAKVKNLSDLRKANMDEESRMSAKIAELEREISESTSSLRRSKERISELEQRVSYMEKELLSAKDAAAANEQRLGAELSTVMKLAELHKESSSEWSKKAGELEGVIKALETHLTQVEDDYKEKLGKETLAKSDLEMEVANLKQKIQKCELDLENSRKSGEMSLVPFTNIAAEPADLSDTPMKEMSLSDDVNRNDLMIVPRVPSGVSGTALAASLLRDGWSLAKIYEKYQEATDALRHERFGRRHAEAVLERVLHEIEEKAELILDERAEHERMVEAYALMDHKLQQALLEHDNFENTIRNLKSELKRWERDHFIANKEIDDLQKQVAVLLKECQDVQLRCGSSVPIVGHGAASTSISNGMSNAENNNHAHMTFNDINGLVQQNVQLRNKVHMLSTDLENKGVELRESFQIELKRITDDAASRVEKVMKKSEEQAIMIESLHRSVAMYRKLCEEQQKTRSSIENISSNLQDDGRKDLMVLFEGSQEISKKTHEQVSERARKLDEELTKLRTELMSLRSERDKAVLEASFARDRLNGFMAEIDHQRKEANSVSLRNAELMHLVVDYEKRLRESSDSMQALEESSRKLSMEVSILKHEKEILVKSERRSLDEVNSLSERVHRLQATIDTIHTTDEVQENARSMERRNQQEYIKRLERDWAELKKEVQEQRDHVRVLTLDKKNAFEGCMKQVEDMRQELQSSWKASSDAEARAAVAEAKCSDLEAKLKSKRIIFRDGGHDNSAVNEVNDELFRLKEELEKCKEEAQANKNYMLQYKEIANSNEVALKQMESAYQDYKTESEMAKRSLEDEIAKLRSKLSEFEKSYVMRCEEAASTIEVKEKDITTLMNDITILRNEVSQKVSRIENLEVELASSKSALDEQCKRWRSAQDNYERQILTFTLMAIVNLNHIIAHLPATRIEPMVILQSETIQELTNTSKQLSSLQQEMAMLRQTADAHKAENILFEKYSLCPKDALRTSGEQEKIELVKEKDEALRKYSELNDQNKILHNRLEALHIRLAEQERGIAGLSSQRTDSHGEDDLHGVVSYLRRSKEIAETEISLLKQEKSRLQIELESALKSSKEAQDLLRSQADSARSSMFKDEEFKSLQLQVREINLLRESNIQLREENRHNFEECQKFREEVNKAKIEAERLNKILLEKQVYAEVCTKDLDMKKTEIANLNQRISELPGPLGQATKQALVLGLEAANPFNAGHQFSAGNIKLCIIGSYGGSLTKGIMGAYSAVKNVCFQFCCHRWCYKRWELIDLVACCVAQKRLVENSRGVDLKTYETMKGELQNIKSTLRENSVELERAKNLLSERDVAIRNLDEKLAGCQSELGAREKKLNDVEASLKSEIDRQKKITFTYKKKVEVLMREKADLIKENKSLLKQIEDLKSSQKMPMETSNVQAVKEKDIRIQTLEKILEKERDDLKKEKANRRKAENVFYVAVQNLSKEKKQIEESIEKHRQAVKEVIEHYSGQSSQIPSGSAVEEQFRSYFLAAKKMEESPSPFQDGSTSQTPPIETPTVDAAATGRQVATPPRPAQVKVMEEKAVSSLPKPSTEQRRSRRVLVRPSLERIEEPQADAATPVVDVSAVQEKGGTSTERGSTVVQEKGGPSLERETSGSVSVLPSGRKRLMPSSQMRDDASHGEANDANPPSKKPKEDSVQSSSELKTDQSAPEDVTTEAPVVISIDNQDVQQQPGEEMNTDQASMPVEEVEDIKDDEAGNNDDMEEYTGASMDIEGQDAEVNMDSDATAVEDVPLKSEAVVESFDEDQKLEDAKEEGQITTATDAEDEREEGELPDEPEQQSDSSPLDIGEQAGDAFRAASPSGAAAKSDADMSEEIVEGDGTAELAEVEPDQSPLAQSGGADASPSRTTDASPVREPSPSNPAIAGASSEQQNPGTAAESVGRTINLTERAIQNRTNRQNRLVRTSTPQPSSSRGRSRETGRGRGRSRRGGQP
ncbi:Nuclear-pore anchor [Triticum urartu]|uniref:Nuclear-pore anchor n=1 Tax=Triticum urartu TaxID=4572 RepID=M7ZUJ1_TRIUA|nr:Nuclear-pore anchor [Triticum urartu]